MGVDPAYPVRTAQLARLRLTEAEHAARDLAGLGPEFRNGYFTVPRGLGP